MNLLFQKKNIAKPVEFIFDSSMPPNVSFSIAESALKFERIVSKETDAYVDTSKTYSDLEMFYGISQESSNVIDSIDRTNTFMGKNYLHKIISQPTKNIKELKMRQNIVKKIRKSKNYSKILECLKTLKENESALLWILKEKTKEEQHIIDSVYFKNKWLKGLNDNEQVMNFYNYFRILFSPIYGLLSPLVFMIVPFIYLRLFTGVKIPFNTYFKLFKMTLFGGSMDAFEMVRTTQNAYNSNNPELIRGMFRPSVKKLKLSKIMSMLFSLILYIQNVFNSFEISKKTSETINALHNKLNNTANYIETAIECIKLSQEFLNTSDSQITHCFPHLTNICFKNNPGILSNKGLILVSFNNVNNNSSELTNILSKIAEIDFFCSLTKLVDESPKEICFPEYLMSDRPELEANEIWHPSLEGESIIKNTIKLCNDNRNAIITGPNAGGKSTFIKSLTLSVLFSQTLGITTGSSFKLTPFSLINTYLNIPDVKGKESLFEAEMHRAREHLTKLGSLKPNEFAFLIMDEIFSSTNPEEGISGGYAICEMLGKCDNSIALITTHFTKLTELEKTSNYSCYKIPILRDENNEIVYTYKLEPGISDQFIALELLGKKGFDRDIVARAIDVCKNLNSNSNSESSKEEKSVEKSGDKSEEKSEEKLGKKKKKKDLEK